MPHVNPARVRLPSPHGTLYTSPKTYANRPLPQIPIKGPALVLQQPQPARPFNVPQPPQPPLSRPTSRALVANNPLIGSPPAQNNPQMARPSSSLSWRRASRPGMWSRIPKRLSSPLTLSSTLPSHHTPSIKHPSMLNLPSLTRSYPRSLQGVVLTPCKTTFPTPRRCCLTSINFFTFLCFWRYGP